MAEQTFESEFGFAPVPNSGTGVRALEGRIVKKRVAGVRVELLNAEEALKKLLDSAPEGCDHSKMVEIHKQAVLQDARVTELTTYQQKLLELATKCGFGDLLAKG
jgi:hypothetical protein